LDTIKNTLLLFNAAFLLNKKEVLESFEDFVEHHREHDNNEGYSESKRRVLLSLCDEFHKKIMSIDVPTLTKPWFFYEYSITNDSIKLSLNKCDDNIEFDETGEISSMTYQENYVLAETHCDFLTVEQYAELYSVTTTTVRQWIRRGKLRTAMKRGRDWIIPALADKPKRGFESATYHWTLLDNEIIDAFPFLANAQELYLYQDENSKKLYYAIAYGSGSENSIKVELTITEREQLEIMLISSPGVWVEELYKEIQYVPEKRNFAFPILSFKNASLMRSAFEFDEIIIRQSSKEIAFFSPDSEPRSLSSYDYTSTYLIPVHWSFWGVPSERDDVFINAVDNNDYSGCIKLGTLSGELILCRQMIADGYDPLDVCDDKSADLEYTMSALVDEGGPLNEWTGDSLLDVFYIDEIEIEEPFLNADMGSRLLQELPSLCLELLHVSPKILAYYPAPIRRDWRIKSEKEIALQNATANKIEMYYPSDDEIKMLTGRRFSGSSYPEELKDYHIIDFYQKNGFQELGDSRLMYAYAEMGGD